MRSARRNPKLVTGFSISFIDPDARSGSICPGMSQSYYRETAEIGAFLTAARLLLPERRF
jgi:hypothetical protein